jgi:hypothetical protein
MIFQPNKNIKKVVCIFCVKKGSIPHKFIVFIKRMNLFVKCSLVLSLILFSSCSRYYLTVDKQKTSVADVASRFTRTPDPDADEGALKGEILEVSWHLPRSFENKAECELMLTYWDYTQETIHFKIQERLGRYDLKNIGEDFDTNKGIIAYKAVLKDPEGKIYQTWEHQLFTKIIQISEEEPELRQDSIKLDDDPWDWESSL